MKKRMKGLTIVEVMVALGAGTVILTALTLVTLTSLKNSRQGSSQAVATQLAQEGMEIMRNMKDNNWPALNALSDTTYCLASTCTAVNSTLGDACGRRSGSSCGLNMTNRYVRDVTVTHNNSKCLPPVAVAGRTYIGAVVNVAWGDSQCTTSSNPYCHSVKIESCFANFDTRLAP